MINAYIFCKETVKNEVISSGKYSHSERERLEKKTEVTLTNESGIIYNYGGKTRHHRKRGRVIDSGQVDMPRPGQRHQSHRGLAPEK